MKRDTYILVGDVWVSLTKPFDSVTVIEQNDRLITFRRGPLLKETCKRSDFLDRYELSHRTKTWNPAGDCCDPTRPPWLARHNVHRH